jgi:hypothetical protein
MNFVEVGVVLMKVEEYLTFVEVQVGQDDDFQY